MTDNSQSGDTGSSNAAAVAAMAVDTATGSSLPPNQNNHNIIAKPAAIQKPAQHFISMHSDSNYTAVARFTRRPFAVTANLPHVLLDSTVLFGGGENSNEIMDDDWAAVDQLSDDDIETSKPEAAVAPLLEEGELDADTIVVSPTGNSALAANNAADRRRREEGWNDLGLDQIDTMGRGVSSAQRGHANQQE